MARTSPTLTNFTAGEISPRTIGRVDIAKYYNAAALIENMIVLKAGGARRRPGSRFVREVKDSSNTTRIIRFEFNVEQSYVIELGDLYARFFANNGVILENVAVTGATQANPVVLTVTGHPFTTGDAVTVTSVGGMVEINDRTFTITVVNANSISLDGEDGSGHTAYTSGGLATGPDPHEIVTPWTAAQVRAIHFSQKADTVWMVHPSHQPRKLTRTAAARFSISLFAPTANPFTSTDNFPASVTFHDQRLHFFATNAEPQAWWASKIADFEQFTVGTGDDDSFKRVLPEANVIRWGAAAKDLVVGLSNGENRVFPSASSVLSPTDANVRSQTTYGSEPIQPQRIDNAIMFVQRGGRRVRELVNSFEEDGFVADDMMLLADHLTGFESTNTGKQLKELAYQREPFSILWALRADGVLLGITYERRQQVAGWHRTTTPGASGTIESVTTIPVAGGDETWIIAKRTIGGATKRYIEYFDASFDPEVDENDAFFVDSGLSLDSGTPVTAVSGLTHLEGQLVRVLADGAVQPSKTVASGSITLETAASKVHVGLEFTSTLRTLPLGLGQSPSIGRIKSWGNVVVLVDKTGAVTINDELIPLRDVADLENTAVPLKTKSVRMADLRADEFGQITITSSDPLPLTVLAITGDVEVADAA